MRFQVYLHEQVSLVTVIHTAKTVKNKNRVRYLQWILLSLLAV